MSRESRIIIESSCEKNYTSKDATMPTTEILHWLYKLMQYISEIQRLRTYSLHIGQAKNWYCRSQQSLSSANQESLLTSNKVTEKSKSYKIASPYFIDAVACTSQSRVMLLWTTLCFHCFFPLGWQETPERIKPNITWWVISHVSEDTSSMVHLSEQHSSPVWEQYLLTSKPAATEVNKNENCFSILKKRSLSKAAVGVVNEGSINKVSFKGDFSLAQLKMHTFFFFSNKKTKLHNIPYGITADNQTVL